MNLNFYEFSAAMLSITLSMSTVIAVLLFVRSFMKKCFTASCRFIIWTLVMLRLCIPVGGIFMPSMISVSVFEEEAAAEIPRDVTFTESTETIIIPQMTEASPAIPDRTTETLPPQAPALQEEISAPKPFFSITPETIMGAAIALWICGAVVFTAVCITKYNISARRIRRSSFEIDAQTQAIYKELCEKMCVRKMPQLVFSQSVTSPMLYGYFSPTIVLPPIALNEAALTGVLSHELTHYKRGDIYLKFMAMIANAFNWANPFAYAAAKVFSSEMELSCDEKVLSGCDDTVRVTYGQVMLDIIKRCYGTSDMLTTGFNPAADAVKERFINILDSTKKNRGATIISIVLILCLISGSLLGIEASAAAQPMPEPAPEENTADITVPEETESITTDTEPSPEESSADDAQATEAPQTDAATEPEQTTVFQETESITPESKAEAYESIDTTSAPETTASAPQETEPETIPAEEIITEPIHVHTYTELVISPTCSSVGYTNNSCTCGHSHITDITSPTYKHSFEYATLTAVLEGEETEYIAQVCSDCGVEVNFKKSVWDGTSIKYIITGPLFFEGEYNTEGELVIYGSGEMRDYASLEEYFTEEDSAPLPSWWLYGGQYDSIVIADSITKVGANSFNEISTFVNTVKIGKDVSYIGEKAFGGITELKTLYLPRGIKAIASDAFAGASGITIKFEGSYEEFMQIDLGNLDYSNVELNTKY